MANRWVPRINIDEGQINIDEVHHQLNTADFSDVYRRLGIKKFTAINGGVRPACLLECVNAIHSKIYSKTKKWYRRHDREKLVAAKQCPCQNCADWRVYTRQLAVPGSLMSDCELSCHTRNPFTEMDLLQEQKAEIADRFEEQCALNDDVQELFSLKPLSGGGNPDYQPLEERVSSQRPPKTDKRGRPKSRGAKKARKNRHTCHGYGTQQDGPVCDTFLSDGSPRKFRNVGPVEPTDRYDEFGLYTCFTDEHGNPVCGKAGTYFPDTWEEITRRAVAGDNQPFTHSVEKLPFSTDRSVVVDDESDMYLQIKAVRQCSHNTDTCMCPDTHELARRLANYHSNKASKFRASGKWIVLVQPDFTLRLRPILGPVNQLPDKAVGGSLAHSQVVADNVSSNPDQLLGSSLAHSQVVVIAGDDISSNLERTLSDEWTDVC